jgi:pimeloyl-ACP methyl ester carboxylesterase
MSTFVFVHGAWHGSWCWAKIVFRLQRAGHNAIVVDLPGRAGGASPCEQVFSIDTDHSPFLSAAPQLSEYLTAIV